MLVTLPPPSLYNSSALWMASSSSLRALASDGVLVDDPRELVLVVPHQRIAVERHVHQEQASLGAFAPVEGYLSFQVLVGQLREEGYACLGTLLLHRLEGELCLS